jgi:hypothetical protein
MTTFEETKQNLKELDIEELLQEISVMEHGGWKNQNSEGLVGWWAVATDLGIIAYFGCETDAFRFRLDYINRILNG